MTPKTVDALQVELDDLRVRHAAAVERVDAAREARQETAGRRVLGEADSDDLAGAQAAAVDAEDGASALASALALVEGRLAEAQERERDAEQARLIQSYGTKRSGYGKAAGRLDRQLTTATRGTAEVNDFLNQLNGMRDEFRAKLDRTDEIRSDWQRKNDRLLREAPLHPGQTVNIDSLERGQDAELKAHAADVARQVDEAMPLPDPAELAAIRARHSSLAPLLLAPEVRRALAEGFEFVGQVQAQSAFSRPSFQGRLYAQHEVPVAEARRAAFLSALRVLASPADRIGGESLKYPGGTAVQAA